MTVIEVVYENGVLKPLAGGGLKEQQHYEAILRELTVPEQVGEVTRARAFAGIACTL